MRNQFKTIAVAIIMAVTLSACWDNPFSDDGDSGLKLPKGCNGYVDPSTGEQRIDQIPGEPTCTMLTTPTETPADQPATPASPNDGATPTETPTAAVPTPTTDEWVAFESEGGIPFNGDAINVDVAPDELEVVTAGPVEVNGITLPGGYDRGSVVIFLPGAEVVHYTASGVIPGSNWHASYRPQSDPTSESTWMSLVDFTVANMMSAPNCTPGTGCVTLDVLIVGPSGVIGQWTVSI